METITYENRHKSPRNLYVVRGRDRSLMVDTSWNAPRDRRILNSMIKQLGIPCEKLDVFITHDHPDHSGLAPELEALGARIFMNPSETRKRTDLQHSYLADEEKRIRNLRIVGVTRDHTPDVYQTVMEYTNRAYAEWPDSWDFSFLPAPPGTIMQYGEYQFEVVPLKGHTFGQCGLYEPEHKLLFVGDQIMTDIVPIVGSQQKDLGMLKSYLASLSELKHCYKDCRIFPSHYSLELDIEREVNRIVSGYMDKCSIMKSIVEQSEIPLTTRDVGIRTYGRSQGPPDYAHFFSCTQIWVKTFSCLEYLYGEGFVRRTEKDGILYWEA